MDSRSQYYRCIQCSKLHWSNRRNPTASLSQRHRIVSEPQSESLTAQTELLPLLARNGPERATCRRLLSGVGRTSAPLEVLSVLTIRDIRGLTLGWFIGSSDGDWEVAAQRPRDAKAVCGPRWRPPGAFSLRRRQTTCVYYLARR